MTRSVVPPLMTRLRCSVESSSDTANILRGCEMTWGLTMARSGSLGVLCWRDGLSKLSFSAARKCKMYWSEQIISVRFGRNLMSGFLSCVSRVVAASEVHQRRELNCIRRSTAQ